MSRPAWFSHLAAVFGYVCVAVAFSWPLALHVSTHFTGDPGGDTGVYVWNQWVFQHEARVEHRNPLTTEQIFSMTGRPVDLTQHNYTLFANLLAFPMLDTLVRWPRSTWSISPPSSSPRGRCSSSHGA